MGLMAIVIVTGSVWMQFADRICVVSCGSKGCAGACLTSKRESSVGPQFSVTVLALGMHPGVAVL